MGGLGFIISLFPSTNITRSCPSYPCVLDQGGAPQWHGSRCLPNGGGDGCVGNYKLFLPHFPPLTWKNLYISISFIYRGVFFSVFLHLLQILYLRSTFFSRMRERRWRKMLLFASIISSFYTYIFFCNFFSNPFSFLFVLFFSLLLLGPYFAFDLFQKKEGAGFLWTKKKWIFFKYFHWFFFCFI